MAALLYAVRSLRVYVLWLEAAQVHYLFSSKYRQKEHSNYDDDTQRKILRHYEWRTFFVH